MINFNADIISRHSIGNVILNDNIEKYFSEMYSNFNVEKIEYRIPDGNKKIAYILSDVMKVVTTECGVIFSIGCNQGYKGFYNAFLHTGQTMRDIIKLTRRQRIFNGSIIVNDDFGISFILPHPYDEIADSISDIPHDLVFNEIYIADYSSWNPCAN